MREYYEKAFCELMRQCIFNNYNESQALLEVGTKLLMDIDLQNNNLNLNTDELMDYQSWMKSNGGKKCTKYLSHILESEGVESGLLTEELVNKMSFFATLYKKRSKSREFGNEAHSYLPIFIGHDKIPQLSWGHAKYAHFFNEKGFNFFEFKHADHLPSKE